MSLDIANCLCGAESLVESHWVVGGGELVDQTREVGKVRLHGALNTRLRSWDIVLGALELQGRPVNKGGAGSAPLGL